MEIETLSYIALKKGDQNYKNHDVTHNIVQFVKLFDS